MTALVKLELKTRGTFTLRKSEKTWTKLFYTKYWRQETIALNVVSLPEVGRVLYFENYENKRNKE
jgi:hypothetical protein